MSLVFLLVPKRETKQKQAKPHYEGEDIQCYYRRHRDGFVCLSLLCIGLLTLCFALLVFPKGDSKPKHTDTHGKGQEIQCYYR